MKKTHSHKLYIVNIIVTLFNNLVCEYMNMWHELRIVMSLIDFPQMRIQSVSTDIPNPKTRKASFFLNRPSSSKKFSGSKFSGFFHRLGSMRTEESRGRTIVSWRRKRMTRTLEMEFIRYTCQFTEHNPVSLWNLKVFLRVGDWVSIIATDKDPGLHNNDCQG